MDISIEDVKKLRDATGVSITKCKEALEEAGGDLEKASEILGEASKKAALKKADRDLGSGIVVSYIHNDTQSGAILQLLCETDFVAKNDEFQKLGQDIAMHITAMKSEQENLLEESFIKNPDKTIQDMLNEAVQKIGERIEIGEFKMLAV